jgi:hypothetical protein
MSPATSLGVERVEVRVPFNQQTNLLLSEAESMFDMISE